MSDQPDNIVLELLRRIRASQERMEFDVDELKNRVSGIELQQGHLLISSGSLNQPLDRFDERQSRIERRLDLVDA